MGFLSWIRFLPYLAAALAVAFVWWLWNDRQSQVAAVDRLTRDLAVQSEVLEREREGRRVADATIARLVVSRKELDAIRREIGREGGNVQTGNAVRDTIDRLQQRRNKVR